MSGGGLYQGHYQQVEVKAEVVDSELVGGEPFELITKLEGEVCGVCGEEAGGVYFGATVCLPCKSFYIRCTKDTEAPDLKCQQKSALCSPSDGRIKCQYCRFQRCRQAGMMRRKEKPEIVMAPEGKTNCVVCGDIANGIHFGVMTCEGCKKFFRRSQNEAHSYMCKEQMKCAINPRTRNACRACRYVKCIDTGMSRDAIKVGRPPNKDVRKKMKPYATPVKSEGKLRPTGYELGMDDNSNPGSVASSEGYYNQSGYTLPASLSNESGSIPQLNINPDEEWSTFFGCFNTNTLLPINSEDIDILIKDNLFNVDNSPPPWETNAGHGLGGASPDGVVPGSGFLADLGDFGLSFPNSPCSDTSSASGTGLGSAGRYDGSKMLSAGVSSSGDPASPFSVGSSGYSTEMSPIGMPIADDAEMPLDLMTLETPDIGGIGGGVQPFFVDSEQEPLEFHEQTAYVDDVWTRSIDNNVVQDNLQTKAATPAGVTKTSAHKPPLAESMGSPATKDSASKRKPRPPTRTLPNMGLPSFKSSMQPSSSQKKQAQKPSPPPTAPPSKKPSPSPPAVPVIHSTTVSGGSSSRPGAALPSRMAPSSGSAAKSPQVSVIKLAKPRTIKTNDVVPLRGGASGRTGARTGGPRSGSDAVAWETTPYNAAAWIDMEAVLTRSISIDYWTKYRVPAGGPVVMTPRARELVKSFNSTWAKSVAVFDEGREALKVKTWSKHSFPSEDEQVQNWIKMTEGIMNGTAALVLLLAGVPGTNAIHKGLKRLLICRSVFSCSIIMNVTSHYSHSEKKFLRFWSWEVKENDPLYEFKSMLCAYAEKLSYMKLDTTEALLLCTLVTLANDYHDVQAPSIEILRTKIFALLYAHINDKQPKGSKERLEEMVQFVPCLRHVALWHDRMMEQLHLVTGVSSKMQRLSI